MEATLLASLQQIPTKQLETTILNILKHNTVAPHLSILAYAETKHSLLHNFSHSLSLAASAECTSGYFCGSLAAILSPSLKKNEAASVLDISMQSIDRALKLKEERRQLSILTGNHNKFVTKTNYKVSRLPIVGSTVTDWVISHCRPSANSSNIVRTKNENGN